ncbi:Exonuclease V, mitochondrial [Candida viswanathii]|uniref:Exonuclease V, mitochondrial n=1 Tax=Candida viswanathii TaxID=5486 RepID=A0A367Y0R5_9ASCO|nr:Exonuclease V, mitochondrial [Candida viswanathii]
MSATNSPHDDELVAQLEEEDKSGGLLGQEKVNRLIRSMILPTDEKVLPLLQNEQLINIYKTWNLYDRNYLPLTNPTKHTPFEFQSMENSDQSYIDNPRLSVTGLLVSGWCELRSLYTVFAGSVRTPPSRAMEEGTKLHLELEQEIHPTIDLTDIEAFIKENTAEIEEKWGLDNTSGIFDTQPDDELALNWAEAIIERLYSLIVISDAREVLLHGYLNLEKESFVEDGKEILKPSSVLVSGVVDQIQFRNPENDVDCALFEEIQEYVDKEFDQVDETPLVDLASFMRDVKDIVDKYPEFKLKFTDLKTRMAKLIPKQESVLASAKFQTFYYRYFYELLSKDPDFAYRCLLENAKRRGFDVDRPLSVLTTFRILRGHYHLFYNDFVKLANGEPIGFEPYDSERVNKDYDFGKIFVLSDEYGQQALPNHAGFIEELGKYDMLAYDKVLLPLLKTWKTPPTLRYLAARAAQFYGIFGSSLGDITTVEYRNTFSRQIIDTMVYHYSFDQLDKETKHASDFWGGRIDATPTEDSLRCRYCDFERKCVIPKLGKLSKSNKSTIGPEIRKFLNDVKHLQKDC